MIRLNHGADVHFRRDRADDVFASLDVLEAHSDDVDLNIIAGDLHDSPVQNTGAAQFPELARRLARIAKKATIVTVYGSPGHDTDGSLDIYEQISDRITVLRMGKVYFYKKERWDKAVVNEDPAGADALLFGLPEPQKKHLLAADSEVTLDQAVRAVLLGYAAIRAKYPEIPAILVYHGQVHGAKMANGEPCEGGVSIDDLALVGADYIAMGDIHKPQRVGISRGLHAYYAGAMHPTKDWNEAGIEFGFNQVTIEDDKERTDEGWKKGIVIDHIPFPHPVLVKIETKVGSDIDLDASLDGKRVWLEVSATKEQSISIDANVYLKELLARGADPHSKVTLKIEATETVRAGEITKLRTLPDKFTLWRKNSGNEATPAQLEKAATIEQEASGRGIALNGGSFTFDRLVLRGSKGIFKKQRIDEISLNLTGFDSGIIGLLGPNGRGKTTIFDSFHMWTEFPSRPGPAYKNFRLKESRWEVYATDHNTGTKYRKRILMDPTLKVPKAEYYLDRRPVGSEDWASVPGIDGRLATYTDTVNRIFGSFELYIRTAYQMQNPTSEFPDISKATKATKKAVLSELVGLSFYAIYKSVVKEHADAVDAQVKESSTRLSVLTETLGDHDEIRDRLNAAKLRVSIIFDDLPGKLEAGKTLAAAVDELKKRAADQATIQDQIFDIENRKVRDVVAEGRIHTDISNLQLSLIDRPAADEAIDRYQSLKDEESKLVAEKTRILEANAKANEAYRKEKDAYDVAVRTIEKDRDAQRRTDEKEIMVYRGELDKANTTKHRNEMEISKLSDDHCPTCKQMLPEDAMAHIRVRREELEKDIEQNKTAIDGLTEKLEEARKAMEENQESFADRLSALVKPVDPAETQDKFTREDELIEIQRAYHLIDIDDARRTVEQAVSAESRIEELSKNLTEIETRIAENQSAVDKLKERIDATLTETLAAKERELKDARDEYQRLAGELEREKANVEHARKALDEYDDKVRTIEALKVDIEKMQAEYADWKLLEKACGPDGIPALELDAVCPTIAAVATTLLREYEDGRYSIRFDTTREGGKGNQIEDFLIMVIDSKDGEEQEFETLSGGEAVWVRKALQDAFGIIRGQNSGVKYMTGFLDESDSALFPESRISYFRMLESAHGQSVRRHTVMVTHSSELQEMLTQKIDVTALAVEV